MTSTSDRYLVTGSSGCLGAWVVRQLLDERCEVVAFDLNADTRRLRLLANENELAKVAFIQGDVSDLAGVTKLVADKGITHIIHCAALQVPFVRAHPALGAQVNVTGTVVIFEAALANRSEIQGLAYASSAGVFGPPDMYPEGIVRDDSHQHPTTLYGVFKQANEATARIYFAENQLSSVGLRPWIIYGPGRDQGTTSGTTIAMLAAAAGVPYRIGYGGESLFQFAPDVARAFIAAARAGLVGAPAFNIGGETAQVSTIVDQLDQLSPGSRDLITFDPAPIVVVARADSSEFERLVDDRPFTPLAEGVARSFAMFRDLLSRGLLTPPS